MKTKYILLLAFLLVATAQLYVPTSMILEQEDVLTSGKTFKFRTQPVDPNDPMRGKYITLWFDDITFIFPDSVYFYHNQDVYVQIYEDEDGFAKIKDVLNDQPEDGMDYVRASIDYPNYYNDSTNLTIRYPFDRFYMEEYKAPIAEEIYVESQRDSLKTSWAVVKVKNGEAALEDVMIDGASIVDIVNAQQNP
jgi:uncharacterized membrane-anchored protein